MKTLGRFSAHGIRDGGSPIVTHEMGPFDVEVIQPGDDILGQRLR